MKYLLLLYGDESQWANATPDELQRSMGEYAKLGQELTDAGAFLSGEGLETTNAATTVRVRDGETIVSDGPFAETREQLGGYYLLECRDLDEAVRWASKVPDAFTGSVEIRPIMDYAAYGYEGPEQGQASA
jgi:hypothetical protein